jgi:hypothetical protein
MGGAPRGPPRIGTLEPLGAFKYPEKPQYYKTKIVISKQNKKAY